MISKQEKIQRLQDCVALLQDVDAMQEVALGKSASANHKAIQELIENFSQQVDILSR